MTVRQQTVSPWLWGLLVAIFGCIIGFGIFLFGKQGFNSPFSGGHSSHDIPKLEYNGVFTIDELHSLERENGLSFKNKFINNRMTVIGKVESVDSIITGKPYILLIDQDDNFGLNGAIFEFLPSETSMLSTLKTGQELKVKGILRDSTISFYFTNCEIILP